MKKADFIIKVKEKIKNETTENLKDILIEIASQLPQELYEISLCIIDNIGETIDENICDFKKEIEDLKKEFKRIEDGDLCIESCSYATGYYDGWGDEDYDYDYSIPNELNNILTRAYKLGVTLINKKQYNIATDVFDLIINANYQCEETDEYSDEVIDTYETSLDNVENELQFKLKDLYAYAVYASYFDNTMGKYARIYKYFRACAKLNFNDCIDLGIEKMDNIENFYSKWLSYLSTIQDKRAEEIIESILENSNSIDEYRICKDNFKNHPRLYLKYISKLLKEKNYDNIIMTGDEALKNISDTLCRSLICYILVDAITLSNSNINKNKYFYEAFLAIKSIPNFLVVLYHGLLDENILNIIKRISYKNNNYYSVANEKYIGDKRIFDFFLGDFNLIYEVNYKNNIQFDDLIELTYLMLLYLNDDMLKTSKIKEKMLNRLTIDFDEYHYKNLDISDKNLELLKKLNMWKENHPIDNQLANDFINTFKEEITKSAQNILENKIRSSYSFIAGLIVAFDEVLASRHIKKPNEFIDEFEKKYIRFNSFRKELNNLK